MKSFGLALLQGCHCEPPANAALAAGFSIEAIPDSEPQTADRKQQEVDSPRFAPPPPRYAPPRFARGRRGKRFAPQRSARGRCGRRDMRFARHVASGVIARSAATKQSPRSEEIAFPTLRSGHALRSQ